MSGNEAEVVKPTQLVERGYKSPEELRGTVVCVLITIVI